MSTDKEMAEALMHISRTIEPPTLRDQFAMAALTGLLAGHQPIGQQSYAQAAYEVADQMLALSQPKKHFVGVTEGVPTVSYADTRQAL